MAGRRDPLFPSCSLEVSARAVVDGLDQDELEHLVHAHAVGLGLLGQRRDQRELRGGGAPEEGEQTGEGSGGAHGGSLLGGGGAPPRGTFATAVTWKGEAADRGPPGPRSLTWWLGIVATRTSTTPPLERRDCAERSLPSPRQQFARCPSSGSLPPSVTPSSNPRSWRGASLSRAPARRSPASRSRRPSMNPARRATPRCASRRRAQGRRAVARDGPAPFEADRSAPDGVTARS